MRLRRVEFGNVFNASGARNFFGEGYWYSSLTDWTGATFVAKTTTFEPRVGNMPLKKGTFQPERLIPPCIRAYPFKGVALNAVGLTGPGLPALLGAGLWQTRTEPFVISFMAVADTPPLRLHELARAVWLLHEDMSRFKAPFALELNLSCPNVGIDHRDLVKEARAMLDVAAKLNVPLIVKVNALVRPQFAAEIADHPSCDALCVSNTIPWGQLPDEIDWKKLFGTETSPLAQYGGGGLSGKPLLPIVERWIKIYRMHAGWRTAIIGGGGILTEPDAFRIIEAGADAIFLGSVAMLRPWRVADIIYAVNTVNQLFR
ncbi:MAG: hypothetical protein Q7S89_03145 [bacterium]|nr:hypothetical protein [bacterium]